MLIDIPDEQATLLVPSRTATSLVTGCNQVLCDRVPSDTITLPLLLSLVDQALLNAIRHVWPPLVRTAIAFVTVQPCTTAALLLLLRRRSIDQQYLAGRRPRHNPIERLLLSRIGFHHFGWRPLEGFDIGLLRR